MICAPSSSTVSCGTPLTDATVPTGMNTGVSISACGVISRPERAGLAIVLIWNSSAMGSAYCSLAIISGRRHLEYFQIMAERMDPHRLVPAKLAAQALTQTGSPPSLHDPGLCRIQAVRFFHMRRLRCEVFGRESSIVRAGRNHPKPAALE